MNKEFGLDLRYSYWVRQIELQKAEKHQPKCVYNN